MHMMRLLTSQNYIIIARDAAENQPRGLAEVFSEREYYGPLGVFEGKNRTPGEKLPERLQ